MTRNPWFIGFLIATLATAIAVAVMHSTTERARILEAKLEASAAEEQWAKARYENAKWLLNKSASEFLRLYSSMGCKVYRHGPLPYPQPVGADGHAGITYLAWETICTPANGTAPTHSWVYLPLEWLTAETNYIPWNRSL